MLPLGKKVLTSNVTKNIARIAGKTLKKAAVETALDMIDGESFQDSAKNVWPQPNEMLLRQLRNTLLKSLVRNQKSKVSQKKIKEESRLLFVEIVILSQNE